MQMCICSCAGKVERRRIDRLFHRTAACISQKEKGKEKKKNTIAKCTPPRFSWSEKATEPMEASEASPVRALFFYALKFLACYTILSD